MFTSNHWAPAGPPCIAVAAPVARKGEQVSTRGLECLAVGDYTPNDRGHLAATSRKACRPPAAATDIIQSSAASLAVHNEDSILF